MACLIIAESAIFIIFVVAYLFYIGKSLNGPDAARSSGTAYLRNDLPALKQHHGPFRGHALRQIKVGRCAAWLAATVLLGGIFIGGTAMEWYDLIYHCGLTIRTNLFGTTFYSLVGLHASHVIVGLIMLTLAFLFAMRGKLIKHHSERLEVLSIYWHFVDAVWVVVFTVVYVLGR